MSDHHSLNSAPKKLPPVTALVWPALLWAWVAATSAIYLYPYRHIIESIIAKAFS